MLNKQSSTNSTSVFDSTTTSAPTDIERVEFEKESSNNDDNKHKKGCCCSCLKFQNIDEAQGFAILGTTRGTVIMTNLFLSTSLLHLANLAAGCDNTTGEVCESRVYGFRPSSLITNIAVISGVLSALLMPVTGAIVDFTPHRWLLGVISAATLVVTQAIQIGTVAATWFPMAILQAIAGFNYQVQLLATFAYLPDLARKVDDGTMTSFSSLFSMLLFGSQTSFLVLIIALSQAFELNDVVTAQMSQGINVAILIIGFPFGWRRLPQVPQLHELAPGRSVLTAGFVQNFYTAKGINDLYGDGLRWFLIAVCFASAGTDAFTTVSVTFMYSTLGMSGSEVGIVFLVALLASVPGSYLSGVVSKRTNPIISLKILLILFPVITVIGAFILNGPERKNFVYLFSVGWGICIGWYYPTANLIFSQSLPSGQESELTGFFIYSSQIIVWLPPLIFTLMNESGIHMKYGLMSLGIFHVIAFCLLYLMAPWVKIRDDAKRDSLMVHRFQQDTARAG